MSRGINKVILVGNLGDDPQVRQGKSGNFTTFSVATSSSYKDATGQEQSNTEWHDLVAYKRIGEICGQYLKKGSKVYIEGSLSTRTWQDQQTGQDRSKTSIVVREMQMLDSKGGGGQSYNKPAQKQSYGEGNRERPPWEQ
jgi:single-strand DNA-binding protein